MKLRVLIDGTEGEKIHFYKKKRAKQSSTVPGCSRRAEGDTNIIHNSGSGGSELASDNVGVGGETARKIMTNDFPSCLGEC